MDQQKMPKEDKTGKDKEQVSPSKDAVDREKEPILHTEGGEMPDPDKKRAADEALGDEAKKGAA